MPAAGLVAGAQGAQRGSPNLPSLQVRTTRQVSGVGPSQQHERTSQAGSPTKGSPAGSSPMKRLAPSLAFQAAISGLQRQQSAGRTALPTSSAVAGGGGSGAGPHGDAARTVLPPIHNSQLSQPAARTSRLHSAAASAALARQRVLKRAMELADS